MLKSELAIEMLPYPDKPDRRVWVYLPERGEDEKLPVIYMTDGQNLFDEKATPYGSWGVIEAVENEMKNGLGGAVIVGIDNGNVYRDSELTPKKIGPILHRGYFNDIFKPEGEIFDGFLMNTVKPYVEKNYPVKTGKEHTAICGSSSGGLQSFFTGMEHISSFACIGAFSPAFLVYTAENWTEYLQPKIGGDAPYLYVYSGAGDMLEKMICDSVEMLSPILDELGYPYDKKCEIIMLENKHNETAWREIFPDFLHTALSQMQGD